MWTDTPAFVLRLRIEAQHLFSIVVRIQPGATYTIEQMWGWQTDEARRPWLKAARDVLLRYAPEGSAEEQHRQHDTAAQLAAERLLNMNQILTTITRAAFTTYNAGGPPERANLTHDGQPVPPFEALGPSVQHKWSCAASAAAVAGAESALDVLMELGVPVSEVFRRRILAGLAATPWGSAAPPSPTT